MQEGPNLTLQVSHDILIWWVDGYQDRSPPDTHYFIIQPLACTTSTSTGCG